MVSDLDIDAKGTRALVVARAGGTHGEESSDDESADPMLDESLADDGDEGDTVGTANAGSAIQLTKPGNTRPHRSSWSHTSTGKAKGGAWCHEVRVRLPARLNPGHHLVISVFGRDAESGGGVFGSIGGKPGAEVALGHAVLPLAIAKDTLAPDVALALMPGRGSKRLKSPESGWDESSSGSVDATGGKPLHKNGSGDGKEGIWVGIGGGIENGHDIALTAVKELLPKYMQQNVKKHMKFVDDKPKPSVFARLRLKSNVHTSCAKIGALYATTAAASVADETHGDDERRVLFTHGSEDGGGGSTRSSASFGVRGSLVSISHPPHSTD